MPRKSPGKRTKARPTSPAIKDMKVTNADRIKGGDKVAVNPYRYDPYKAARFH